MKNVTILFAAGLIMFSCTAARTASMNNVHVNIKEVVKNPETTLVDVRIPAQFAEKTAANAVNIPLAKIKDNIDFFKKQKNIVVFCNSGKQAAEAIDILKQNGVQNVYSAKTLKNVEAIQNEK
ncbi:MAG: rhodanese-like domain-containing protein [Kaistella sp.]